MSEKPTPETGGGVVGGTRHRTLGLSSWFGYQIPLEKRLRLIKKVGFEATTLWWGEEQNSWSEGKEAIPQLIRDTGLTIDHVHVPYNNANVTKGKNPPAPVVAALDDFRTLAKAAEDAGIVVAVENGKREDHVQLVLREVRSPNLGFCYDSSHARLYGSPVNHLLAEFGDMLATTHLSDNDGLIDQHWLPGEGLVDWGAIVRAFPNQYSGCVMLEVLKKDDDTMDPEAYLRLAYERAVGLRLHDPTAEGGCR